MESIDLAQRTTRVYDSRGRTALHNAVRHPSMCRMFVRRGWDMFDEDYSGANAIHLAAQALCPGTLRVFLGLAELEDEGEEKTEPDTMGVNIDGKVTKVDGKTTATVRKKHVSSVKCSDFPATARQGKYLLPRRPILSKEAKEAVEKGKAGEAGEAGGDAPPLAPKLSLPAVRVSASCSRDQSERSVFHYLAMSGIMGVGGVGGEEGMGGGGGYSGGGGSGGGGIGSRRGMRPSDRMRSCFAILASPLSLMIYGVQGADARGGGVVPDAITPVERIGNIRGIVNGVTKSGNTALHLAMEGPSESEEEEEEEEEDEAGEAGGEGKKSGRRAGVKRGGGRRLALVQCLLATGGNPVLENHHGDTALRLALRWGHRRIVSFFLDLAEYDVIRSDPKHCYPLRQYPRTAPATMPTAVIAPLLLEAVCRGSLATIEAVLKVPPSTATIDAGTSGEAGYGRYGSPLHAAVYYGFTDCAAALLRSAPSEAARGKAGGLFDVNGRSSRALYSESLNMGSSLDGGPLRASSKGSSEGSPGGSPDGALGGKTTGEATGEATGVTQPEWRHGSSAARPARDWIRDGSRFAPAVGSAFGSAVGDGRDRFELGASPLPAMGVLGSGAVPAAGWDEGRDPRVRSLPLQMAEAMGSMYVRGEGYN